MGSISPFCEPEGGQCECKPGVGGRRCDSCGRGSYGLKLEGSCAPCNCSQEGTVPGTECDPHTGQCECKASYKLYFFLFVTVVSAIGDFDLMSASFMTSIRYGR